MFGAASEAFSRKNTNCSIEEGIVARSSKETDDDEWETDSSDLGGLLQLAREATTGSLALKDMPKRKNASTMEAVADHAANFKSWLKVAVQSKVRVCVHRGEVRAGGLQCQ